MTEKVLSFIKKYHLIEPGDRLIVALSGGADSVALLHFLKGLRKEYGLELLAVHVNHGIRKEAGADEAFCAGLCEELGVSLRCCHIEQGALAREQGMGLEEAARAARYALLERCRQEAGFDKIVTAHHANDNAETMLFQLFRGSGLRGLSGIPAARDCTVRPFLCVTREEIGQYLRDNGLAHVEDATNQDLRYSRNRIRAEIIPAAELVNAAAVENMSRCAEQLKDIQAYLEAEAEAFSERNVVFDGNGALISLAELKTISTALQREVLFENVSRVCGSRKDITFSHIEAVRALLDKDGQKDCALPYGVTARKSYDTLRIFKGNGNSGIYNAEKNKTKAVNLENCATETYSTDQYGAAIMEREAGCKAQKCVNRSKAMRPQDEQNMVQKCDMLKPYLVPYNGQVMLPDRKKLTFRTFPADFMSEKINNIPQNDCTKWFDCDKIRDNLMLRHRRQGDYLTVTADGGRKSLKDYLINAKVPRDARDSLWLLADGPHILWVIGLRISMAYKVTETTKNILEVHWEEKADGGESGGTDSGGRGEPENS